jgi:hypothetical protein
MSDLIRIKRGLKANLPALMQGEFGFCTDTEELFIGGTSGNILIAKKNQDQLNVKDFGAKGNGTTDDTTAFQLAIDTAISLGIKTIYIPSGTFFFAAASASLDPKTGDLTFKGNGYNNTIMLFNEGTGTTQSTQKELFENYQNIAKGSLEFVGIQFKGTFTSGGYVARGGACMALWYYPEINIHDCKFYDMSFMATWCEFIGKVKFVNNHVERIAADMCRFRSSSNVFVDNNYFKHCDDDAIALHQNAQLYQNGTIRESIIVSNNILEDVCGIKILGGREVSVHDNILRRVKESGIHVIGDTIEGANPMFGISIHNNQIYDSLSRAPFTSPISNVIVVQGLGQKGGSETSGVIPGQNASLSKTHTLPFPYRNKDYNVASNSLPPSYLVSIHNNIIAKTLYAGNYSDWGYGQAFSNTGFSNPAVSDINMRPGFGIYVEGNARNVRISENTISCVNIGIGFAAPTTNFGLNNIMVAENLVFDFDQMGVFMSAGSELNTDITFDGNSFDADPYHTHANRGATGGWSADGLPQAIRGDNLIGIKVMNNRFKNLCSPISSNYNAYWVYLNNIIRCDPTINGFNTGNKGVGNIFYGHGMWLHEIYGCDPTASDYMKQKNITIQVGLGMPTSGKYVVGHFVQNVNYGLAVHGWVRLNTGTGHAATDWKAIPIS